MNRRSFLKTVPAIAILTGRNSLVQGAEAAESPPELQPIALVKPDKDGGRSVLAALWERKTTRSISEEKLPPQMLSNLLWAAWGVNRENVRNGRVGRTAASASNSQEIDVYVILPEGGYL